MDTGAPPSAGHPWTKAIGEATYRWIPEQFLKRLGIRPIESRPLKIASGKVIRRKLGLVLVTVHQKTMPSPVLFGDKGREPLLGAITLEELGVGVDALHRTLVPATAYLLSLF